jgi:hypothetical protein
MTKRHHRYRAIAPVIVQLEVIQRPLVGTDAIVEYLAVSKSMYFRFRKKYREVLPAPIVYKRTGKNKGARRLVLTWTGPIMRWWFQILTMEEEARQERLARKKAKDRAGRRAGVESLARLPEITEALKQQFSD